MVEPSATHITSSTSLFAFYDIESLNNAFTLAAYVPRTNTVEVFYLIDEDTQLSTSVYGPDGTGNIDPKLAGDAILASNPVLPSGTQITFFDLRTEGANRALAQRYGLSDAVSMNDPNSKSSYDDSFRITCDTDLDDFDPITKHPFLAGYNSYNYDSTMLSIYLYEAFAQSASQGNRGFQPPRAKTLREHNDNLFSEEYIRYMPKYLTSGPIADGQGWDSQVNRIRANMIASGRHIDVARLNEKQQRVPLKRLLGMLGHQIMESDKLGSHNATISEVDDFYELLAYNVSDVVGLGKLFDHWIYGNAFDLKRGLMEEYPEVIYNESRRGSYKVKIAPNNVRRGRLTPDSSSAKFVGLILSPYGRLSDIEQVSFEYPSKEVAQEEGIEQMNVLTMAREFFYETITDPTARAQFDEVYQYYRSIEGKNFNDSDEHLAETSNTTVDYLANIPKRPNNLPYFHADGTPSSCFATFSTGGIHGAEADTSTFENDLLMNTVDMTMIKLASALYPEAADFVIEAKRQHNLLRLPDGSTVDKPLVATGTTQEKAKWRLPKKGDQDQNEQLARAQDQVEEPWDLLQTQRPDAEKLDVILDDGTRLVGKVILANTTLKNATYKDPQEKASPTLFELRSDGSTKLKTKYAHTSVDVAIHEDFSSYYPNLLRNMGAFYNERLGEDRYTKIFHDKESYGVLMKDPSIPAEERKRYKVLREGTKLILNTASGAGDAGHKTPIRMNNRIISMRLIGQVFSWLIGQAQTHAGARIISTNTDGLYSVLDEETNNRVLAERAEAIRVEIEPETLRLVTKDSNNRLELKMPEPGEDPWNTEIVGASGATLACHEGPDPNKSLAHPAIIDWGLVRYLQMISGQYVPEHSDSPLRIDQLFDREIGRQLLEEMRHHKDPVHAALMFQNMVSASAGSITYPFATDAPRDAAQAQQEHNQAVAAVRHTGITAMQGLLAAENYAAASEADRTMTAEIERLQKAYDEDRLAASENLINPRALQRFNRTFIVRPGTPGAVNLRNAGAWKITEAVARRRDREGDQTRMVDDTAAGILETNGLAVSPRQARLKGMTPLPIDQDISIRRISGVDPAWSILVLNDDLSCLSQELIQELLESLDLEVYLEMLASGFEANWMNAAQG